MADAFANADETNEASSTWHNLRRRFNVLRRPNRLLCGPYLYMVNIINVATRTCMFQAGLLACMSLTHFTDSQH